MFQFYTKSGSLIRNILFSLFLLGISVCIWNTSNVFFSVEKLSGSFINKEMLSLNMEHWFSSDYQHSVEEFVILNNPISPFFVRVKNQLEYSLFDKVNISGGVLGKEKYLYEKVYIDAYYGRDYLGEETLRDYVQKMKFVQDTLRKLNKEFLFIQCPGKASFFPEYIPDSLKESGVITTNYTTLVKLLNEYDVNFIDFKPYFLENKYRSAYPLFTHTGIHWSKYATYLVVDSITNYLEYTLKLDLPEFKLKDIETDYARGEDDDLEHTMNLMCRVSPMKYGYPIIHVDSVEDKKLPRVFMMSDSYLGALYTAMHFFEFFNPKSQYWFYNIYAFSLSKHERMHRFQLDQNQIIDQSDIVLVGSNEPNVRGLSWGFINEMYNHYKFGCKDRLSENRFRFMAQVDSCKKHMTQEQIKIAVNSVENQNLTLDSAKTVYAINKVQEALFKLKFQ